MPILFLQLGNGAGDPRSFIIFALFAAITLFIAIFDFTYDDSSTWHHRYIDGNADDHHHHHMDWYSPRKSAPLLPREKWQILYRPTPVESHLDDINDSGDDSDERDFYSTISSRLYDSFVHYFFGNTSAATKSVPTESDLEMTEEDNIGGGGGGGGGDVERARWSPVPPWLVKQRTMPNLMQFEQRNMREHAVWYYLTAVITAAADDSAQQQNLKTLFLTLVYPRLMSDKSATWDHALLERYALIDGEWKLDMSDTIEGHVSHASSNADGTCIAFSVMSYKRWDSNAGKSDEIRSLSIEGHCHVDGQSGWKPFQIRVKSSRPITALEIVRPTGSSQLCIVTSQQEDHVEFRRSCIELGNDKDKSPSKMESIDGPPVQSPRLLWNDIVALHSVSHDHIVGLKLHGSFNTDSSGVIKKRRKTFAYADDEFEIPMIATSYTETPQRSDRGDENSQPENTVSWKQKREVILLHLGKQLLSNSMGKSPFESILFGKQLIAQSQSAKLAVVPNLQSTLILFKFSESSDEPDVNVFDYSDYVENRVGALASRLRNLDYDIISADTHARLLQQFVESTMSQVYAPKLAVSDKYETLAIVHKSVVLLATREPGNTSHKMRHRIELRKVDVANPNLAELGQQGNKKTRGGFLMSFSSRESSHSEKVDLQKNLDIASVQFEEEHDQGNDENMDARLHLLVMYVDGTLVRYDVTPSVGSKIQHTSQDTESPLVSMIIRIWNWLADVFADKWRLLVVLSAAIGIFIANERAIRRRIQVQQQQREQQQQQQRAHQD